jgi:nucleoside-diphosphate-sugar epimerase
MKIFFAGATGAIGRQLLPRLTGAGHFVTAITRSPHHLDQINQAGAHGVVCDIFDREALFQAMSEAEPEVVMHQLTAIPPRIDPKHVSRDLAATNALRIEGTEILMQAAKEAGAQHFIAQSIATYYQPDQAKPATEDMPLYKNAPSAFAAVVHAVQKLEDTVLNTPGIQGTVLRYGHLYGSGTVYAADGTFAEDVRARRVPIIGSGGGTFSFIHVEDAANATVLALTKGVGGIYNIVDDEPVTIGKWLPIYAELASAPKPMRVPAFIGRLAAGPFGVYFMTEQRGASNKKAKRILEWNLDYSTWREGFQAEFAPQLTI